MPVQMLPRSSFALYAELGITLAADCEVTGDVGVRSREGDTAGWQLSLEAGAVLRPASRAIAPSVKIAAGAQCPAALADRVDGQLAGDATAASFPYDQTPPLPLAPAPDPGAEEVTVPSGEHRSIAPGDYGNLRVHGTLTLAAGEYVVAAVTLGADAILVAGGRVRIAVLRRLTAAAGARLQPQAGAAAAGLVISVSGTDREGGPAVRLGPRTELRALLVAPHATVAIGERAEVTGAVAGFRIDVGARAHVRLEDGLPGAEEDARGYQALPPGYGVPAGPGTDPVVAPVPSDWHHGVCLGLPTTNGDELQEFLGQVSDPRSPQYRQFLTQEQFSAAHGAPPEDYAELQAWAAAAGLFTLGTVESNLLLAVGGTADQIQRALFVNLVLRQRPDGSRYPAADRALSLDVRPRLLAVSGIGEAEPVRPLQPEASGLCGSFTGPDLRRAYLGPTDSQFQQLDGTGQTIGIVGTAEYVDADLDQYEESVRFQQGTPALPQPPTIDVKIVFAEVDAPWTPDPGGGGTPTDEAVLDVDMVYAMAPGAAIRFFKSGLNWFGNFDNCLAQMANYPGQLTVATCSWQYSGTDLAQSALDHMAALGCSFMTSSGDDGCTSSISSNLKMNNQTIVGGTILFCAQLPVVGPPAEYPTPYYAEEDGWPGSGGGVMSSGIPDYQTGIMAMTAAANGGSKIHRNYPDVAMIAQSVQIFRNGSAKVTGGTSSAAQVFGGFIALANQYSQQQGTGLLGFLNPVLYAIGETVGQPGAGDLYSVCFHDVEAGLANTGSGGSYNPVPGYDLVTGLGSPTTQLIIQLGTVNPISPSTQLTNIRFIITTGDDNLRDDSSALANVLVDDLRMFTVTLKPHGSTAWANGSVHQLDFAVPPDMGPLTETTGIVGVQIQLVQGDGFLETADNWDISILQVSLFSPGSSQVCQLNLVGHAHLQDGSYGLVRLSATPGSSGSGPRSPIYLTGPGSGC